ncbi:Heavy metal-associated domain superfamily [Arabidopsis suecica]|uniref:Heavy metal transport/detoxification superfamily protein n=2 Tax=Arabidopsis TaxID=3701 RepID=A0A5S9WKD0_ARATH|nr:Heavy metal-associated domain superfamily [Arabidopsis suecica]CAA0281470.1 unnamed protein product [Arabidopsis thaliana]
MAEKGKEKVTWMKLKTEPLSNEKNFSKVKKALSSIPQVRDQKFEEETNTVTIKVVCCSPEKVMDKLCSKGRGAIKLIETIEPAKPVAQKPKEPEKPKEAEKPKEPEKPKPAAAPAQGDPSSQRVTHGYNPPPMMGHPVPWSDGPNYGWSRPNGYDERPIYNSYGGWQPPPSQYGGRSHYEEEQPSCSIM